MSAKGDRKARSEEVWRAYMTEGRLPAFARPAWYESKYIRPFVRLLPTDPRCRLCYYPFHGIGGAITRSLLRLEPSKLNPQICNICENLAGKYLGGQRSSSRSFLLMCGARSRWPSK
jgi:hypothetical protein